MNVTDNKGEEENSKYKIYIWIVIYLNLIFNFLNQTVTTLSGNRKNRKKSIDTRLCRI